MHHQVTHSFITEFTMALSLSPPLNKAKTHFYLSLRCNPKLCQSVRSVTWAPFGHRSLPVKGGELAGQRPFVLDLKDSHLVWGVLLRASLGEDERSSYLCLLVFFGDFGLLLFLFLVQSCTRDLLSGDCLWYIPDGGCVIRRRSAPC